MAREWREPEDLLCAERAEGWIAELLAPAFGEGERNGIAAVPVTLVPATIALVATHSGPSLSLSMPGGWRLEFAALPAADWLRALCAERR